ncbi:hypothetical protein Fot_18202 [Forsythia ovata]|uniref:Uncharacterized protein n=1 Tax=Forsythia ovata TaxID=205694 RepID=A0ABD1VHV7_9LAMI
MSSSSSSPTSSFESEMEELRRLEDAPPFWKNPKAKRLSKQLSMLETPRDIAWEKHEDLSELKGCIELGFGFNEEQGQKLCNTLPALDLYFAVNRQFSMSPMESPNSTESAPPLGGRSTSFGSPRSDSADSWKICSPGDDPQHVKTKLRHWAQAVACSLRQSS